MTHGTPNGRMKSLTVHLRRGRAVPKKKTARAAACGSCLYQKMGPTAARETSRKIFRAVSQAARPHCLGLREPARHAVFSRISNEPARNLRTLGEYHTNPRVLARPSGG